MEENPINLFNDSPEITTYKEQCDLLKMISIPSFGIYSNDYAFLEQILILKKNSCPNNLPQKAKNQINYLRNKYPEVKPEYFHITLSSEILFNISPQNINSFSYTALNFISHPYIFYNCQLNREHKSDIFCAAYTDEQEIDTIKQENGDSHLRVNPECNMDDWQLKREVYIHLSNDNYPSLSPNNCHLLINLNSQFINFYVITCGTYHGKIVKIFVGNFVIIPNISNSILFNDIYKSMLLQKKKENLINDLIIFKNKYNDLVNYILNYYINEITLNAKNIEQIKKYITKSFSIIFELVDITEEEKKKELENISTYYYNNITNYINHLYPNSEKISPIFGEKALENSLKNNYIEELLLKYVKYNTNRVNCIISNMISFITDDEDALLIIQNKSNEKYDKEISQNLKFFYSDKLGINEIQLEEIRNNFGEEKREKKCNPNIEILINICKCINNKENINIDELDDIIKIYLFYIVWEYKGKVMGVHDNFGKMSFMNINEIDQKFFCNDEDKINCCQKLIQLLVEVDEKNF